MHPSVNARSLGLASVLWLGLHQASALDLTPETAYRRGNEGVPTPVMQFTDKKKKITYRPPAGWRVVGGAGGKSLGFAQGDATMDMRIIAKKPQADQTDSGAPEDLKAWAAQFVPATAQNLILKKTLPSPFLLGGRPSTEFDFAFSRQAGPELLSVFVVDYSETERFVLLVSAREKFFDSARAEAVASMFSWAEEKAP